jgi:hypothetical protein
VAWLDPGPQKKWRGSQHSVEQRCLDRVATLIWSVSDMLAGKSE